MGGQNNKCFARLFTLPDLDVLWDPPALQWTQTPLPPLAFHFPPACLTHRINLTNSRLLPLSLADIAASSTAYFLITVRAKRGVSCYCVLYRSQPSPQNNTVTISELRQKYPKIAAVLDRLREVDCFMGQRWVSPSTHTHTVRRLNAKVSEIGPMVTGISASFDFASEERLHVTQVFTVRQIYCTQLAISTIWQICSPCFERGNTCVQVLELIPSPFEAQVKTSPKIPRVRTRPLCSPYQTQFFASYGW